MFFVASKLLVVLTDPLTLCFIGLLGVWGAYQRPWARKVLAGLIMGLYVCSTPFITRYPLRWLEGTRPALVTLQPHYDLVIVLTGMLNAPASTDEQLEFVDSVDRILAGIRMVKTGRADKLLISGGSGSLFRPEWREAPRLKAFALQWGLTEEQLLVEEESRNTYESAVYTARLLQSMPRGRLLLITSATHMRRSAAVFRKQGLFPDLYPVDFSTALETSMTPGSLLPSSQGLEAARKILYELVGLTMYRLQGYL